MKEQKKRKRAAPIITVFALSIGLTACSLPSEGTGLFGPGCSEQCADAGDACPEGCDGGTAGTSGGSGGSSGGTAGTGAVAGSGGGPGGTGGVGGADGGSCVPTVPTDELCDGVDNDCDPNTEDGSADPQVNTGCNTGLKGNCEGGTQKCTGGSLKCIQDNQPKAEVCSSKWDEDCDGKTSCYDSDCSTDTLNCRYTVVSDGTEVTVMVASNDSIVGASLTDGACGPTADVIGNPGSDGKILIWKSGTSPTTKLGFAAGAAPAVKYHCSTTFAADTCPGTPPTNQQLVTEYQATYPSQYATAPYSIIGSTITVTMTGLCSGGPYELIAEIP